MEEDMNILVVISTILFLMLILGIAVKIVFSEVYFKRFLHLFSTIFEEEPGVWSMNRFVVFVITICAHIPVLIWGIISLFKFEPQSWLGDYAPFYGVAMTIALGGKIMQKREEMKNQINQETK
jgi:hypothetical protein